MAIDYNFKITQGEADLWTFTQQDEEGGPDVSFEATEATFSVLQPGGAVSVWGVIDDNEITFDLVPEFTSGLEEGRHQYQVWLTWPSAAGDRPRVAVSGFVSVVGGL